VLIIDLLLPVIFGLVLGLICRRSIGSLAQVQLRQVWLLWLAAAVQVSEYYVPVLRRLAIAGARPYFTVVIFGSVAMCLWSNAVAHRGAMRAAWLLVATGLVLNAIPLISNGTMPFSRRAALSAGIPAAKLDAVHVKNGMAHAGTAFAWLGDIIPVAGLAKVISVGDCAICLGAALLIFAAMDGRSALPTTTPLEQAVSRWRVPVVSAALSQSTRPRDDVS
jgi:hypothetical protein